MLKNCIKKHTALLSICYFILRYSQQYKHLHTFIQHEQYNSTLINLMQFGYFLAPLLYYINMIYINMFYVITCTIFTVTNIFHCNIYITIPYVCTSRQFMSGKTLNANNIFQCTKKETYKTYFLLPSGINRKIWQAC